MPILALAGQGVAEKGSKRGEGKNWLVVGWEGGNAEIAHRQRSAYWSGHDKATGQTNVRYKLTRHQQSDSVFLLCKLELRLGT